MDDIENKRGRLLALENITHTWADRRGKHVNNQHRVIQRLNAREMPSGLNKQRN